MAYSRFQQARAHRFIKYTGGNITCNQTAVTALHATDLDMTIEAQIGDVLEYGMSGRTDAVAQFIALDVYSIVAGNRVNPFAQGLSTSMATTDGVSGWLVPSTAVAQNISGSALKVVEFSDLANGAILLRPYYAKTTTTARAIMANLNSPLMVWVKNLGPSDPE